MRCIETSLKDCFILEPKLFDDSRGSFYEIFNKKEFYDNTGITFNLVQDNVSSSRRGVLRGLHYQKEENAQAKLIKVFKGEVLDVSVDLRKDSKTFGDSFSIILNDKNKKQLFIPRGFAHGFLALSNEVIFNYKCDNYYNKESEGGIIYNDPDLNINWNFSNKIILSEKDSKLKSFKEFIITED